MSGPRSIKEIDLSPKPGKKYWSCDREWREEFIYFVLVDRFHDDLKRQPVVGEQRSRGSGNPDQLRRFCGGTLKGLTAHLDYIAGLGCTAVWLSPIFENDEAPNRNSGSYHGYATRNYLNIDPRFGTKEDLIALVDRAHQLGLRVFLDAVANHTGNVFRYRDGEEVWFRDDCAQYEIGEWRDPHYPVPIELRDPARFHRRGQIRPWAWDAVPETQWGDFVTLKGLNNDETPEGIVTQEIMIAVHRYWIREADIDGYRMDAVKHMGDMAVARFAQAMREYAYKLGKREFFLYGELVAGDNAIHRYTGPNTAGFRGDKTIYYGLSSVLDFPLFWTLPGVIKGFVPPGNLIARYEALKEQGLSRGELGRYLVTFLDNHDQIGQQRKMRFAAQTCDEQVIAGIGYLLCALGTPCIYYGTEQGFAGEGGGDEYLREAMFDLENPTRNYLNPQCRIYREIAAIAKVNREKPALRFGRMYFREISGNGTDFGLPTGHPCTLAFSRILADQEVLVAFNTSTTDARCDHVVVDYGLHQAGDRLRYLYGDTGEVTIQAHPDPNNKSLFVELPLAPMQFVILG